MWLLAVCGLLGALPIAAQPLVLAARQQIGVTVEYNGSYERLRYPLGDVPLKRGVCTDVIVRAYRVLDLDLQQLVHEDMVRHFAKYPRAWGLKRADANIDHRRVPNLQRFFERHGQVLDARATVSTFQAGDLVTFLLPGNLPHIGIVSDQLGSRGAPLLIHNVGAGTQEEDALQSWPITGRYRYPAR